MARLLRPELFHGLLAFVLCWSLVLCLLALTHFTLSLVRLLAWWVLAVNLVTLAYYGFDKSRAQNGGRRVPEVVLHGLAVCGGSLGAYLGMRLFRHKTLKSSFRFVFWFITVLQVVLIVAIVYHLTIKPRG